jgi:catechol 2,3-dioxygenase-like lactoylglutathione lyase family enzyme
MSIQRIESVTYGVADVAAGIRFFDDIGLEKVEEGSQRASFRTPVNQFIHVRDIGDASLPKSPESGSTMREIVWGVDSQASLDALGAELSRDREVSATPDGTLHTRDETGFAIAFAVSKPIEAKVEPHAQNSFGATGRLNRRFQKIPKPHPLRLAHAVFLIRPEGGDKACDFYLNRVGLKLTDAAGHLGKFMRVPGIADHHSLLLMWIRKIPVKFDHIAFEMRGFDDVMSTGPYMEERGWKPTWGPGRQPLGCHMFWHFDNPCGGEVEFFTDMDRFDDTWEPVTWQGSPGSPWTLDDQIPKMENQARAPAKP